ncbi:MAG: BamA/TamA family outer membrane protein [Ignavibacteriales bacterium]|nr:BamA/TamA family outer membrane protein [Ignavibacteriales bacterium]
MTIAKLIGVVALFVAVAAAQSRDTTVVAGAEYDRSGMHRLLFGENWRDVWATPIVVPVLDVDTFAGGLTALKRGGGMQTKTLHLVDSLGRRWKFRSINKDARKLLPPEMRSDFSEDIAKDQISSAYPAGALVVAPLLDSLGILNAPPALYVMPDHPALGEWRQEFAGMLGTLEEHPDENEDEAPKFAGSEKIFGSIKLFKRLADHPDERVDQVAYLEARLVDLLVGDWDRHSDQWRWAAFDRDGARVWEPIPRDRDQAFVRFDWIAPKIAVWIVDQLNHFDDKYPDVFELTFNARYLDKRLLSEIDRATWDSVARATAERLDDETIEAAIKASPPEYLPIAEERLTRALKSRRDALPDYAGEFYELINEHVEIYGTNERDSAVVRRTSEDETEVALYYFENDEPTIRYEKMFRNDLLGDVRVFLLDGDDVAVVEGEDNGVVVRIIGGEGEDRLVDRTRTSGWAPTTLIGAGSTKFYDSDDGTEFVETAATDVCREPYDYPEDDIERYEPRGRDYGAEFKFYPLLDYGSEEGVSIVALPKLFGYDFRMRPYRFRAEWRLQYAFGVGGALMEHTGQYRNAIGAATFKWGARFTQLDFARVYPYGMRALDVDPDDDDYYDADMTLGEARLALERTYGVVAIAIGAHYRAQRFETPRPALLAEYPRGAKDAGDYHYLKTLVEAELDRRDSESASLSGYYVKLRGEWSPVALSAERGFGGASADARAYVDFDFAKVSTLALRAAGERRFGDYPFFESAFLGGDESLRGFRDRRFSGEGAVVLQAEWRQSVAEFADALPGVLGVSFFAETGRTFGEGVKSERWRPSCGVQVWRFYLNRGLNFMAGAGFSEESITLSFGMSLDF